MIQQFHFSICPKELKARSQRGICILRFTAALSAVAKWWKQSICALTDEWISKMRSVYIQWNITQLYNGSKYDTCYNMDER